MTENNIKIITENRKARHDYSVIEAMEAGMELVGTEVKSLRAGKVNLKDSFVRITKAGELVVMNMHIMIMATIITMIRCGRGGCSCIAVRLTACWEK